MFSKKAVNAVQTENASYYEKETASLEFFVIDAKVYRTVLLSQEDSLGCSPHSFCHIINDKLVVTEPDFFRPSELFVNLAMMVLLNFTRNRLPLELFRLNVAINIAAKSCRVAISGIQDDEEMLRISCVIEYQTGAECKYEIKTVN